MGRGTVRAGTPTTGTQAADGTDNSLTDPRIILFDPPVRPCIVANTTGNGNKVRIKVNAELNGTVSNDFDNDADDDGLGHVVVSDGESADLSIGGALAVHSVSFVTLGGADDLDTVTVVGWEP